MLAKQQLDPYIQPPLRQVVIWPIFDLPINFTSSIVPPRSCHATHMVLPPPRDNPYFLFSRSLRSTIGNKAAGNRFPDCRRIFLNLCALQDVARTCPPQWVQPFGGSRIPHPAPCILHRASRIPHLSRHSPRRRRSPTSRKPPSPSWHPADCSGRC